MTNRDILHQELWPSYFNTKKIRFEVYSINGQVYQDEYYMNSDQVRKTTPLTDHKPHGEEQYFNRNGDKTSKCWWYKGKLFLNEGSWARHRLIIQLAKLDE